MTGALRLASRYYAARATDENWDKKCSKVFQFALQTTSALVRNAFYELSLRLFLQCALAADACGIETIAYEFLTQSFVIYEENVADSKSQVAAITLIIGTLQSMRAFGAENLDTLTTKCALLSSKLLRRPDQCGAVQLCSHLFWHAPNPSRPTPAAGAQDGKRVLECLQRSLKIGDACIDPALIKEQLFVEILNRYLYYFDKHNEAIAVKHINSLVDLINTNTANMEAGETAQAIAAFFKNTVAYINWKKAHPDPDGPSYEGVDVSVVQL